MKTSKKLFPAINELYDLKFTDEHIEKIVNYPEADLVALEGTLKDSLLERLFYVKRTDSIIAYVSSTHRRSREIEFEKVDDTDEENPMYIDKDSECFALQLSGRYGDISDSPKVRIKTMTTEDISGKLHTSHRFITSLLINMIGSDAFREGLESEVYEDVDAFCTKLKNAFIEFCKDSKSSINIHSLQENGKTHMVEFIATMLPDAKITTSTDNKDFTTNTDILREYQFSRLIDTVIEFDNHRLFFVVYPQHGYNNNEYMYYASVVDFENPDYDYVDVGRVLMEGATTRRTTNRPLGSLLFLDMTPTVPASNIMQSHLERASGDVEKIGENDIKLIIKRFEQRKRKKEEEVSSRKKMEEKIAAKLNTLMTEKGKLKINGVTYTKDAVEYEGQILTSNIIEDWVYTLLYKATSIYKLEDINFDFILQRFLELVTNEFDLMGKKNNKVVGKIGEVEYTVEARELTNVDGVTSIMYYVNNKRINKEEVRACLERCLCFTKQADYEYFVSEVSKCSIKVHGYLQRGIDIHPYDSFEGCQLDIKLMLERTKNLNYLVVNDKTYKIKNTQRLIKLEDSGNLMDVVNALLDTTIVEGLSIKDIGTVIKAAKKSFITAIEKSKQLLKETEELFKISVDNHVCDNGRTIRGYLIKGTLDTYILESKESSDGRNAVYRYPSGNGVCIVDKSTSQVGKDKLVNRIFALHNDSMIASEVHTLNN